MVTKFEDRLSVKVAESSKRSDPIAAISDCPDKLIEVSTVMILICGLLGILVWCPI